MYYFASVSECEEDARNSHLLFTVHVYQYRVDKNTGLQKTTGQGGQKIYFSVIFMI